MPLQGRVLEEWSSEVNRPCKSSWAAEKSQKQNKTQNGMLAYMLRVLATLPARATQTHPTAYVTTFPVWRGEVNVGHAVGRTAPITTKLASARCVRARHARASKGSVGVMKHVHVGTLLRG